MKKNIAKIVIIATGLLSFIWFLIRVIPKPSRASYPCQQAAFPLASGFVIWMIGIVASARLFRVARFQWRQKKYLPFIPAILAALICFLGISILYQPAISLANKINTAKEIFIPVDLPNSPMGEAKGIFQGRVVWAHNPEATSWDGKTGYWWKDQNTNSAIVEKMLSGSLQNLTGTKNDQVAWDSLFHSFNRHHLKGNQGYTAGQKVAVKLNMNTSGTHGSYVNNTLNSHPQMVLALLKQMVNNAGIPASEITFYDISRLIPGNVYSLCKLAFPEVNFVDNSGGDGRLKYKTDEACAVKWSQKLTLEEGGGNPTYLPTCVSQADYLINLANLKGHDLAGISLCGKNHFGTIISNGSGISGPVAAGVHPYIAVHNFAYWNMPKRDMKTYNTIVDLMGHKDLGNKTLLFLVDGLYASRNQSQGIVSADRWLSKPFNNDWPSSIFLSQDNVAIESVCLDFLRTEQSVIGSNMFEVYGNVDNYLHEAAMANNAPSGVIYDPEQDGTPLKSLGVHEHWNNETDKKYSRNLGIGTGIELIAISGNEVNTAIDGSREMNSDLKIYPNPAKRGSELHIISNDSKIEELVLVDIQQRIILNSKNSTGKFILPENMSPGIYVVRVKTTKGESISKVLVQ